MSGQNILPGVYALELIELVERWGVSAEELLEGSGFALKKLEDPSTRLDLRTCAALSKRACELTGEPGLAVYFGLRMRLPSHGFLGFAAMTAGTLGEAARLATRFSRIRTDAITLAIGEEDERVTFTLTERIEDAAFKQFVVIALMIGIAQLAFSLTGQKIEGVAECAFPEPPYFHRFVDTLAGAVVFDKPRNRILANKSVMELPIVGRDPVAMRLAAQQCERELTALDASAGFTGRVREALEKNDSLERVAKALGMSARTLKRKLAAEGTSFSDIVDEQRREEALARIVDHHRSVEEIATELGYSDVANFVRAFRRWTGETPAAYRRQRQ